MIRLFRHHRDCQQVHLRTAHHIVRHAGVDLDHRVQDIIGVLCLRAGDFQGKQVRVRHRLSGDAAVDRGSSHLLTQHGLHQLRLQQIGEGLAQLLRHGLVVIIGRTADIRQRPVRHLDGERHRGGIAGRIAPPAAESLHRPQQDGKKHRQPEQPPEYAPELLKKAEQIDLFFVRLIYFMIFHVFPPPVPPSFRRSGVFRSGHSHSRTHSHNRNRIRTHSRSHGCCGRTVRSERR